MRANCRLSANVKSRSRKSFVENQTNENSLEDDEPPSPPALRSSDRKANKSSQSKDEGCIAQWPLRRYARRKEGKYEQRHNANDECDNACVRDSIHDRVPGRCFGRPP
jgi:hypothetical protein